MKTVMLAVTFCVAPVCAYAQFNDLMKTLQTITPPRRNQKQRARCAPGFEEQTGAREAS